MRRLKKGQSRDTGNTGLTKRRKNKTKTQHNMHLTPPYTNRTYVLSQTTGGKDKPNIAFMMEDYHKKMICKRKPDRLSLLLLISPL
jgi:hypothetical protein